MSFSQYYECTVLLFSTNFCSILYWTLFSSIFNQLLLFKTHLWHLFFQRSLPVTTRLGRGASLDHGTYHTKLGNCLFSQAAVCRAGRGRPKYRDQHVGCCSRRADQDLDYSRGVAYRSIRPGRFGQQWGRLCVTQHLCPPSDGKCHETGA